MSIMLYGFSTSCKRSISVAAHSIRIEPMPHPSRCWNKHEIFYVMEGQWVIRIKDEEYVYNPTDIGLLPANSPYYGEKPCKKNSHIIYILFDVDKKDQFIENGMDTKADKFFLVQTHTKTTNFDLSHFFSDIVKIQSSNLTYKKLRCMSMFNLLFAELSDIYRQKWIKKDAVITDIVALIHEHPYRFYAINELSQIAGLSRKTLTRRFMKETGQTLHQYQMSNKLDRIAEILSSNSYIGLKNLAANFGFCDEFHLSSSFKKRFGVSPAYYKGLN
jgi:AraC-like DNA-binding protein